MTKKTGAYLTVYALEQLGVKFTYGIPGVHNTEIYDVLNSSDQITPVLVTHEAGASFMADATSRTTDQIGVCVIVPAAGLTHAMSGIGEAFLDGIPMMIISGGTRRDSGKHYQLHQIDQCRILDGIIKEYFLIEKHSDIVSTIYKANDVAINGTPGPVFIEIPVEIQMFQGSTGPLEKYHSEVPEHIIDNNKIQEAVGLLKGAKHPGIYAGWGSLKATDELKELAEILGAPVSTTLQGLSCFPANHPLHTGVGFGPSSVPAAQKAFSKCDVLIAIGLRFAELATGSYGIKVPENLIHIDINQEVFNKNYSAKICIEGDAKKVLSDLNKSLRNEFFKNAETPGKLKILIHEEKKKYKESWENDSKKDLVSPGMFFKHLSQKLRDDAQVIVDDGKHTFLTAELLPINIPGGFISPTDFNCMGYCVPATIACKLNHPGKQVIGIVGDGAFQMTGMEMITASTYGLGVVIFVFHDGELGQISQFQKIPLNRKTCTKLGILNVEGVAIATGARYLLMKNNHDIIDVLNTALDYSAENIPVIVDVNIDYTRKTYLTKGVIKTNLSRFPMLERARFIGRALKRHIMG